MPSESVNKVIELMRAGEIAQAKQLLAASILENPQDADAWYGMATLTGDKKKKLECLIRVLEINPKHEAARRYLRELVRPVAGSPVTVPEIEQVHEYVDAAGNGIVTGIKRKRSFLDEWIAIAVVLCIVFVWAFVTKDRPQEDPLTLADYMVTETTIPIYPATDEPAKDPTLEPTHELTPEPTGTFNDFGYECIPNNSIVETGSVIKVIDGDTIKVNLNGNKIKVRYIGIDAPETEDLDGVKAKSANEHLVLGQSVTLVNDVSETDQYGRLLRYVFVANSFINFEMVKDGFAVAVDYPPDTACSETLHAAEEAYKELGGQ